MKIEKNPMNFVIGAVARATGIPVETLRVWERRYRVVTPHRDPASNKRYYTSADISRLKLIRQLVELGHSISSVAGLSDDALEERLDVHADSGSPDLAEGAVTVMVCGEMLPQMVRNWPLDDVPVSLLGSYENLADFENAACASRPQVLIKETPFLLPERLERFNALVARTAPRRGIVVYGYGPASLIESGRRLGLWMVRGPLSRQTFIDLCRLGDIPAAVPPPMREEDDVPPPRFDSATLARIATTTPSIRCECPQHMADLVFRLHAFERYSADCQNRNEQDAALHAHLRVCAGKARGLFEDALAFLIAMEGMDVSGPDQADAETVRE